MTTLIANRDAVIDVFRDVLARDDAVVRSSAVKALEKVNADDEKSIAKLVELLRDGDVDVRLEAVVALGRMRAGQAALPLLENLEKDPEGEVRIEVVKALSRIRSLETVERLINCFKEDGYPELDYLVDDLEFNACWEVQSSLMDTLAKIGDSRAVVPLIEVLESGGYEDLQESGFRALAKLSGDIAREFLLNQLKSGGKLAKRRAASALSALPELTTANESVHATIPLDILAGLSNALLDSDPHVRINAAKALAVSGSAEMVVPITLLLNDPVIEVRCEAVSILATSGGSEIVDRLHQCMKQDESGFQKHIVRVLGEIADPTSLKPISLLLDSQDNDLLYEAVVALTNIGQTGPEQKLANILSNQTHHYTLRMQVAQALGSLLGGQQGLKSADSAKAERDKSNETVTNPEQTEEPRALEDVQQKLSPMRVLEETVFDSDERVAGAALEALVKMDSSNAADRLVDVLELQQKTPGDLASGLDLEEASDAAEGEPEEEISQGLTDMVAGHNASTSTLAAILANQASSNEVSPAEDSVMCKQVQPEVRILAVKLLAGMQNIPSKAVITLTKLCKEEDQEIRRHALHSLAKADAEPLVINTLLEGLDAKEEDVRLMALGAIVNFSASNLISQRLTKMLEDPSPTIRQRVVEQLPLLQGIEISKYLSQMLEDEDLGVCRSALAVLCKENYTEEIGRRVENLLFRFSSNNLTKNAAAALRRMQDAGSSTHLLKKLNDEQYKSDHWVCIEALAEMYSISDTTIRSIASKSGVKTGEVG